MNQEKIGAFLAECRKQKNLTQEQLSEILGVSSKSISRWENGKTMPDYAVLDSLCNALGLSINEFYYGKKMTEEEMAGVDEKLREYMLNMREQHAEFLANKRVNKKKKKAK